MDFKKDLQYRKFCCYGFLKNLKFFEPFFILYLLEIDVSFFQIGILFSIRAIAVNIMEIPTGVIADTIGRRTSMIFSFISYIISFIILFISPVYIFLIPAMLFFAFGEAFRTGTHKAMILTYLKINGWEEHRTAYYGNVRSWSQRGSAVSALIAAALVFYSGNYRSIFIFTLIPYILELFLMLSYPKSLDGFEKVREKTKKTKSREIIHIMLSSLKNRSTRISFLNSSIPTGFFAATKDYIQPILASAGIALSIFPGIDGEQRTALITGIIYSIIFLLSSFASKASGKIVDCYISERPALNLSFIMEMGLLITAGILYSSGLGILPIIVFMLYYFIQNLRKPMTIGYISEQIDYSIMATALSLDSQLKTVWVALLSPLIGIMIDLLGLGYALAAIGILGMIIFPLVKLRKKSDSFPA